MELRQLVYFVEAANVGSFSAAAESQFVSHQALSKSIAQLERELGVNLFDRSSKGIVLTDEGRKLLRSAKGILDDVDKFTDTAKNLGNASVTVIRIGMIYESLSNANFSVPIQDINEFTKTFPQVEIKFYEAGGTEIEDMVRTGELDFGIVTGKDLDNESVAFDPFATLEFTHWVISRNNPLATRETLDWTELESTPIIKPPHPIQYSFNSHFGQSENEPSIYTGSTAFNSNLALTYNGMGVSMITESQLPSVDTKRAAIVPLTRPVSVPVCLIWSRSRKPSRVAIAFRRHFLSTQLDNAGK